MGDDKGMKKEYWLWMVMIFGAGNPKIWTVLQETETPERAYHVLQDAAAQERFSLNTWQKRSIQNVTLEQAQKILENCAQKAISVTCYGDGDYPSRLLEIYNPPTVLFYQGNMQVLEEYPAVTVVGTRNPTEYSVRVASAVCGDLARAGVVIVSGFAVGLDSTAHRSALLAGGCTVAVLGCGIDVDYPRVNVGAKKYIPIKGLLLSEFLPGTEPHPKNFPMRNRILSGISLGTLVIQAPERSGSLITASLALEQGRNVFCIPPADLFDNRYAGVVKYLRDGAIPVFSYLDIVNEYYHSYTHKIMTSVLFDSSMHPDESVLFGKKAEDTTHEKAAVQGIGELPQGIIASKRQKLKKEKTAAIKEAEEIKEKEIPAQQKQPPQRTETFRDFSSLDGLELQIAVLLSQEHQMHIDAIVEQLEADESAVASALTELAIDGYVSRFSGQCYGIL